MWKYHLQWFHNGNKINPTMQWILIQFKFRIFDFYAVVGNFAINFLHNFIGSGFFLLVPLLFIASLDFIISFVGWIRVARQWVWWVLSLVPLMIFFYRVFFFYIWCRQTNQIRSMMSLTKLGLTPDSLIRTLFAIFLFWWACCWCFGVWNVCADRSQSQRWYFCAWCFCTNRSQVQRWSTLWIILVLKFFISPPNFNISFIVIVWICAHSVSNHCRFSKNMIRRDTMSNIHKPSNYVIGGPDTGNFIQCINGWDPQIHELWFWNINGICCEVHLTACVEIPSGTAIKFVTD